MRYVAGGDVEFQLDKILNGGVDFTDNLDGAILEATTTGAVQEIRHALGRVPIGFLIIFKDAQADIWGAQLSSWTREIMFLQSNVSNVELRLFVM